MICPNPYNNLLQCGGNVFFFNGQQLFIGEFFKIKVLYSSLAIRAQEAEFIMVKPTEE